MTQRAVADGPGSTMWINAGPGGQASQGPASQPPEGRGGTILLDPNAGPMPDDLEFGTVKLGPQGWAPQSAPGSRPPSSPPASPPAIGAPREATYLMDGMGQQALPSRGASVASRPPMPGTTPPARGIPGTTPPAPDTRPGRGDHTGDYTMFATEKRSPAKFVAMLLGGALVAIGLGGGVAYFLMGGSDKTEVADDTPPAKVAKADEPKDKKPAPEEPVIVPPTDDAKADSGAPEIPEEPPSDDGAGQQTPPPEDPPPEEPPPEEPKDEPQNDKPSKKPVTPHQPKVKESLAAKDVAKGFAKANKTATSCPGGIPGMKIKVQATIGSEGHVISAKALSNAGLPAASCVVKAVEAKARFVPTKKPLDIKTWTYTF